ncbi:hypothetical protein SAFG77S_03506 [Streptomyces afghaniensis]
MSTAHSTWFGVGWRAWVSTSLRGTEHQASVSTGSWARGSSVAVVMRLIVDICGRLSPVRAGEVVPPAVAAGSSAVSVVRCPVTVEVAVMLRR